MRYVCYTHAIYRSEGRREREREREVKDGDENREGGGTKGPPGKKEREKKDKADRKSSSNEALSFSSGASPISLTSADLPAYYPACVHECVHVSNKRACVCKGPTIVFASNAVIRALDTHPRAVNRCEWFFSMKNMLLERWRRIFWPPLAVGVAIFSYRVVQSSVTFGFLFFSFLFLFFFR